MKHKTTLIATLIALIVVSFTLYNHPLFVFLIIVIIALYITSLILGSGLIQLNYFVNSINKSSNKGIALTFDDGPDPTITPKILQILAKENIKATFFVIGHKIETEKEILKQIYNEGHTIGNHSYSHTKELTFSSSKKLIEDFSSCTTAIENVIKQKTIFFRPPFGVTNPKYKKTLASLNLKSIGWSIRSLDTKTSDAKKLYNTVTKKISNGDILLFHDTQSVTVEVLPEIINYCKNNGINIVSLPQLINEKPYE